MYLSGCFLNQILLSDTNTEHIHFDVLVSLFVQVLTLTEVMSYITYMVVAVDEYNLIIPHQIFSATHFWIHK